MCTLTMLGALEVVRTAYCVLQIVKFTLHYWHFFPKIKMAADAILDFQIMWICPFRPVDSVVFVLCTKFGSNFCTSHWDWRIYASDVHLMTSRELTSGFDFWSRGHLRMAVMHVPIKFGVCLHLYPAWSSWHFFLKLKMAAASIWDLLGNSETTHEGSFVVRTPCKNFVMIG